jgi:hypothetical protein
LSKTPEKHKLRRIPRQVGVRTARKPPLNFLDFPPPFLIFLNEKPVFLSVRLR